MTQYSTPMATPTEMRAVLFFGLYRLVRLSRDLARWVPSELQAARFASAVPRFHQILAMANTLPGILIAPSETAALTRFLSAPFDDNFRQRPWPEQAQYMLSNEFQALLDLGVRCFEEIASQGLPGGEVDKERLVRLLGAYWQS